MMLYKNKASGNNYLRIKLEGEKNTWGYGCKVFIETSKGEQIIENTPTHGYQSNSEPIVHIGLGAETVAKNVRVVWPSGKEQILENVKSNQTLTVKESEAKSSFDFSSGFNPEFSSIEEALGLDFNHLEMSSPDFERNRLLPHKYTINGPGTAVGDVNGDGLMDLFIANARESSGAKMYIQSKDGKLKLSPFPTLDFYEKCRHDGLLIFDADGDGDNDLYCAAGGSEYSWPNSNYKHRLYLNDGTGNFKEDPNALPGVEVSGGVVIAGDIDGDKDLDLFVGGRVIPGYFPIMSVRSYVLLNENGKFKDITKLAAPDLETAGLITSACFMDFNQDSQLDLVLTGEYLPVVFMQKHWSKI